LKVKRRREGIRSPKAYSGSQPSGSLRCGLFGLFDAFGLGNSAVSYWFGLSLRWA